jgi:type IV secretory pathway TraG/TraD family ATPase VirD4
VWFVCDELDSLGKVDYLDSALSKGRKYGLSVVSVIQSIAQLDHKYGHDLSKVLRSVHVSKIIMRQGSNDDAEYWSREIGEQLRWESSFSDNVSHQGGSSGSSRALQQRRVVLPAELMSLKDLTGYAILQDRPEISFFEIPLQKYDKKIEAFIDRKES